MKNVLTIIMAGGEGTRLSILANRRAKPAVPFAGIYRIIDFALSNAMHSGARLVGIITQYRPYSLVDHVGLGEWWGLSGFGRMVKILSPYTGDKDSAFYSATADAIYHNIEFIERFPEVTEVLILSGDHIYKMDYRPMLDLHREQNAVLTVATQAVGWEETSRFGIMVADDSGRIIQFQEKPKSNPLSNQANLGVYIFNRKRLVEILRQDQTDPESTHDFGRDIIPGMIRNERVFIYPFTGFWRDVGTIQSYVETNMEALDPQSGLDLEGWGVRTNFEEIPLSDQPACRVAGPGRIRHSLISTGAIIEGEVEDSILSPGVRVERGARVRHSILLHDVKVGEGAVVEDVIVDKMAVIGRDCRIGDKTMGEPPNQYYAHLLSQGTTVIGKSARVDAGVRIGRHCLVFPNVHVKNTGEPVASGSTLFPVEE